ncbi:MAG: hypothetical protein CME64_09600 [Halobacteriovoraceae bacterium]|nr:hypothetical protein [Halobacteriovoraceae bacterium]
MLFKELNLKETSLKAIEALGFESPSEIQEKSIPLLMDGDIDFIGQAQTGTGKTAAFTLPLLEKIDFSSKDIQSLILAPTRELANQICEEIKKLSKFEPVRTLAVYGGQPVSGQLRELRRNKPQVIVGTPGRVLDFINRDALKLETCKYVILDEADEMLDMGFFDDVNTILSAAGENADKKIWMFSATMPKPILALVKQHFADPQLVKVTRKNLTADSVKQQFAVVRRRDQVEALCRYLDYHQNTYAIVFTRTKVGAKEITDELNMRGFPSDALHGDMSQEQRDLTMKKFKEKKINLLICTDVAARGIDVNDLTHVINFSLPQDNESYVHRIGRTGRGGNQGIALSIIEPSESRRIRDIERITKAKIEKIKLPKISEIKAVLREKSYTEFSESIEAFEAMGSEDFENFKEKFADVDKEDILKGAFSFIFNQSLKRYKNAQDLDVKGRERDSRDSGAARRGDRPGGARVQRGYEKFFLAFGRKDGMDPGNLIKMVSRGMGVRGSEVGRIDVKDTFSFFEMPERYKDKVLGMNSDSWNQRKISVEVAQANAGGGGGGRGRRNGNRNSSRRRFSR